MIVSGIMDRQDWDARAGRSFYSSAAWLDFCRADYGVDVEAVLATAVGGGKEDPKIGVPIVHDMDPRGTAYDWNEALAARALPALPDRGILVGPREGYQTHLLHDPGPPDPAAVAGLRQDLLKRAGPGRACVAMFLDSAGVRLMQAAGVRTPPVLLEADAWLEVPEDGFDAWLAARTSNRRTAIRRECRLFAEADLTVEHTTLAACVEQVAPLAAETVSKYGHEAVVEEELAALRNHVTYLGDAARVALCRRGDAILGFCLYYRWSDTVFLRWTGFAYDQLPGAAEYFNLVIYEQLRWASAAGVRWLHAGLKSIEAKVNRGACLRPLWLLDLSASSPLLPEAEAEAVHRANREIYGRMAENPVLDRALEDRATWEALL